MKLPGLMGTISLATGLVLALPMGIIGVEFLAQGRVGLGLVFLGLGAALLFLPEYVWNRLPRPWTRFTEREN